MISIRHVMDVGCHVSLLLPPPSRPSPRRSLSYRRVSLSATCQPSRCIHQHLNSSSFHVQAANYLNSTSSIKRLKRTSKSQARRFQDQTGPQATEPSSPRQWFLLCSLCLLLVAAPYSFRMPDSRKSISPWVVWDSWMSGAFALLFFYINPHNPFQFMLYAA